MWIADLFAYFKELQRYGTQDPLQWAYISASALLKLNINCFFLVLPANSKQDAKTEQIPTYYSEVYKMSHGRRGTDLAFINSGVLSLWIAYPQAEILRVRMVNSFKPLIRCICIASDSEQVNVSMPHPGHLWKREKWKLFPNKEMCLQR